MLAKIAKRTGFKRQKICDLQRGYYGSVTGAAE